jgi:hypothetical protein
MNWFIAVPVGWAVVALVLGLIVGNGIRIECGVEPEVPVGMSAVGANQVGADQVPAGQPTGQVSADRAGVPVAADSGAPAPVVAVGQTATDQRPVVQVRQALLTGAR